MRYYSKQTGCTYLSGVHGKQMPEDAVPISEALYLEVIANPPAGKIRAHDQSGLPCLIAAPEYVADPASLERAWRDSELAALVWLRDRHRDQLEMGVATTLTPEQFAELLGYMQALRDWPQSPDFPGSSVRPVAPPWIAEQTP